MLTLFGTDSGKMPYTKGVDNLDIVLVSTNTSSSDKWSRSNDLCKSGVLLEVPVSEQMGVG
jgi:hypothetical protein